MLPLNRLTTPNLVLKCHHLLHKHSDLFIHQWTHPPDCPSPTEACIDKLAVQATEPLTLADLVKYGKPPLSESLLITSANFSLSVLPSRLARRIQSLRNLPFIVVSNKHISRIYQNYLRSFLSLLPFYHRRILSLCEEVRFSKVLEDLVETHENTIPILARGFLECKKYISAAEVTRFLDEHLRARIGMRLIAEQHLALRFASTYTGDNVQKGYSGKSSYIGVIDTDLRPASIIQACEAFVSEICNLKYGVRPHVLIDGHTDASFVHVPVHIEYIVTELLKNAFRAVIEHGQECEPVQVTIAKAPNSSTDQTPGISLRIRDHGGGISPTHLPNIWSYSFTTFDSSNDDGLGAFDVAPTSSIAGFGYGLPLSKAYVEYFGGRIALESLWGWGTDVYVEFKGMGIDC